VTVASPSRQHRSVWGAFVRSVIGTPDPDEQMGGDAKAIRVVELEGEAF
jgi:hypothetical protein